MDMPHTPASSEKSLEKILCQCVENLNRKEALKTAAEPASMLELSKSPSIGDEASPNRGNGASPSLHHERGSKCRARNDKMGPQEGGISKRRQQRRFSKITLKVYTADPSNFRALVYERTCQLPSSTPPPDVATLPTSPLTPQSITSASSRVSFTSQSSGPTTPHSIIPSPTTPHSIFRSSFTSPLSSPHHGYPNRSLYVNSSLPFEGHAEHDPHPNVPNSLFLQAEHGPHLNTHFNVHPGQRHGNQSHNLSHNTSPGGFKPR